MKINGIFVACAVLSAAATYPALDLAETLGISENRISPISTGLIGGCVFQGQDGTVSSLSIEKNKYLLSESILFGVSDKMDAGFVKAEVAREFGNLSDHKVQGQINAVKEICDSAERDPTMKILARHF